MKFKVGDYVKVVLQLAEDSLPVGAKGTIIAVDEEWDYPYELDSDIEYLYNDSSLQLADASADEEDKEEIVEEAETRKFIVQYYTGAFELKLFTDTEELIFVIPCIGEPKENRYLQGFFDGLLYSGIEFEVSVEYYQ